MMASVFWRRSRLCSNASRPQLGNPRRLIRPKSSARRKRLGRGLPVWATGVTVPASAKPKPTPIRPSRASASLSKPADMPSGLVKSIPQTRVASTGASGVRSRGTKPYLRAQIAARWAKCGGVRRNSAVPGLNGSNRRLDAGTAARGVAAARSVDDRAEDIGQAVSGRRNGICLLANDRRSVDSPRAVPVPWLMGSVR